MFQRRVLSAAAALLALPGLAHAKPTAPSIVCATYPEAPDCQGKVVSCAFCHESTDPPSWNAYGTSVKDGLQGEFDVALPDALRAAEALDADMDGASNVDELRAGSSLIQADATSGDGEAPGENPRYRLGAYDLPFALRRVTTLYCGRSPSYEEMQAFREAGDEAAQRAQLHEVLSGCLQSDYWQKTLLPRLADKRIKPLAAAGPESKIPIAGYRLVVGDYMFDYRLWQFVLSNDRDMRELLTADYYVLQAEDGTFVQTWDVVPKPDDTALAGGQLVEREHRAGMITTQWFLTFMGMFSALPRTTAAQAYRSYLGADIAASEGLIPIEGQPTDIDEKGVAQPRCAVCHSTLDPLSYAFARYEGIQISADLRFGAYNDKRPAERMPGWSDEVEKPYLLGQPVANLVEWAHVAAESDEFARTMVEMFFGHALGRTPEPADQADFAVLWKSLPEDGFSANRMIHRMVDTLAFGAP